MKSTSNFHVATQSQVGAGLPLLGVCLLFLLLAGCPRNDSGSDRQPEKKPLEGVKLRLAVVDDPALAAAVVRVQGEWNAQTGASLQVEEMTEKDLTQAETLSTDAVICPSHMLGILAERELIAPVPIEIVKGPQWADIFELPKLREAAWGAQAMAVPLGSPLLTCYYRADLLTKLGRRPPRNWDEYQDLAKLLTKRSQGNADGANGAAAPWCGTIEPLAPGWAGLMLLARAAPLAKHRDNYSTLFSIENMEPLVAEPAMVQALAELVAAAKLGPADPMRFDPAAARAAFWNGQCGMALTWPTAAEETKGEGGREKGEGLVASATSATSATSEAKNEVGEKSIPDKIGPAIRVGFVELPGSRRVFNLTGRVWDNRADDEDPYVPLLAASGRLGVVSKANKKPEDINAAFQLLLWLSDNTMSPQVSAASSATTLFRQSHLKSPGRWVEKAVPAPAAAQYGDTSEAAFRHEQWLGALRIPGRAEYLAALDEAVAATVRGDKTPLDALLETDAKWRKITEQLGVDRQKAAYRHSLGLE